MTCLDIRSMTLGRSGSTQKLAMDEHFQFLRATCSRAWTAAEARGGSAPWVRLAAIATFLVRRIASRQRRGNDGW